MKTLKPIFKTFTLMLLLAFAACKKDGAVKPGPDPVVNKPVTSADLVNYSIPVQLNVDAGLRIIYFNKDGNDIKATYDAVTVRRIFTVNLVNNTWVMDLNGDGSVVYTFKFGRNDKGELVFVSANYKKQSDASVKMQTILMKNADIPPLAGTNYMEGGSNSPFYLKFSDDHNFAISNQSTYPGAPWISYYDISPGAWKGTYNGVDYLGITVRASPNEAPMMYLQIAGDGKTHTFNLQK